MKTYRIIFEGSAVVKANSKEDALGELDNELIDRHLLTSVEEEDE